MKAPEQSRAVVWQSLWITAPAAFYFSIVADLPHVFLTVLALYGINLCCRRAWKLSDRSVIYPLLGAAGATVVLDTLLPLRAGHLGYMSYFARPEFSVPFLLYLGALYSGLRRRSFCIGIAAAAMIFCFAAGGDVELDMPYDTSECRLTWERFWMPHFPYFYGGSVLCSLTGFLFAASEVRRFSFARLVLRLLAAGCVAGAVWYGVRYYQEHRIFFRRWEQKLLQMELLPETDLFHTPDRVAQNLREAFPADEDPDEIVVRVVSSNPPGHLRCGVFARYRQGSWLETPDRLFRRMETGSDRRHLVIDQLFAVRKLEKTENSVMIYPVQKQPLSFLPIPGNTVSVELIAEEVLRGPDGELLVRRFKQSGGINAFVEEGENSVVPQIPVLNAPYPREYLGLSRQAWGVLRRISAELHLSRAASDAERFARVLEYLELNCAYSTDWKELPKEQDPVAVFLTERRRGHCELFAAAAALLLRTAGVPTRYVTGIIVSESHSGGYYYIGRRRDRHAWCEAFDRDKREWVMIDPVPARIFTRSRDTLPEQTMDFFDRFLMGAQELLAQLRRGRVILMAAALFRWLRGSGFGMALLLLLITGAAGTLLMFLRRKRRREQLWRPLEAERRKAQAEFLRRCRVWRKKGYLEAGETPGAYELLHRFEGMAKLPDAERKELLAYLKRYLQLRYGVRKN